ncbi:hypothetical protein Hypma_014186 [Hypsizygus marmoreus]|uniref:Uncharacterized protein n=1 Tax=Hypsizygus marmoreus TaxID=39966 RepID=A0A369K8M2_HYPMA|nr:hypothetical protein Hypma_014186 [Hypsizygus marmoreus]
MTGEPRHQPPDHKHLRKVVRNNGDDLPHQPLDRTLNQELAQGNDRRASTSASGSQAFAEGCAKQWETTSHINLWIAPWIRSLRKVMTGEPRHQPPDHKHLRKVVRNNGRRPPTQPLIAPWIRSLRKVMTGEPRHQPPDHKHLRKVVRNNGRRPPTSTSGSHLESGACAR